MLRRFVTLLLTETSADILVYALSKFISIPSVSSSPDHREDCRQTAIWLTKCLAQLGASSKTVRALFLFAHFYFVWGYSANKWIGLN